MYHSSRSYSQEFLHHFIQSKFSEFFRQGNDNGKKWMISVDNFKIKLDTGYVFFSNDHATRHENIY